MVYYGRGTVKQVVASLGISVKSETDKRFNCLCPFHNNTDSPAFSIDNERGLWICFNESCGQHGNLEQLVSRLTGRTEPESLRFIALKQTEETSMSDLLGELLAPEPEFSTFPQQIVDQLVEQFWNNPKALEYMEGRGFDHDTLRKYEIGFTNKEGGEITYPVHSPDGSTVVGLVGRGVDRKFFDNSKNLPKKRVLWNLHNARSASSMAVVTESGFDAMRVSQAGYPNSVATLGASLGQGQLDLLERNFSQVVVFSDNDEAGLAMRKKIEESLNSTGVLHACWDYGKLYPEMGVDSRCPKDAGDLTISQIQQMINNAMTSYEAGIRRIE